MNSFGKKKWLWTVLLAALCLAVFSACGQNAAEEITGTLPIISFSAEPESEETLPAEPSAPLEPETPSAATSSAESESASAADVSSGSKTTKSQESASLSEGEDSALDYAQEEYWAYLALGEDKPVDVFLLGPTVVDDGNYLHMEDRLARKMFVQSLGQQQGLYESLCCLYAPYYRQMAAEVYLWEPEDQKEWRDQAFTDVAAAFRYFLDHYDTGKPLILAGFSQGSELCLRLMQEFFDPDTREGRALLKRLVAVYAIGAGLPESMVEAYPWLKPAEGETDTGVIISFDCEQAGVTDSVLLPAGSRSMSINPLSWSRDGAHADKSLNKGAYFPGIDVEEPQLCGCYIEPERGALVVTGINPAYFPVDEEVLPPGNLHVYDYQFFYRNIQENVIKRIEAFLER